MYTHTPPSPPIHWVRLSFWQLLLFLGSIYLSLFYWGLWYSTKASITNHLFPRGYRSYAAPINHHTEIITILNSGKQYLGPWFRFRKNWYQACQPYPIFVCLLCRKSVWLMPVSTENEIKLDPSPFIADFKTTPEELGLLNSSQTDSILNLKLVPWIALEKQWFYRQQNW